MNRTPEQWAQVKPDAFLDGSIVQARNVIEMMQQDIRKLARALDTISRMDMKFEHDLFSATQVAGAALQATRVG